jgi:signal transduction histidine kinase
MSIRTRYLLSLLIIVAVMVVPAFYAVQQIGAMRAIALDLRRDVASTAATTGRLSRELAELDRLLRAYVATADPELVPPLDDRLAAIADQVDDLRTSGFGQFVDEAKLPLLGLGHTVDTLHTFIRAGALQDATAHLTTRTKPLLAQADEGVVRLSQAVDRETARRAGEAERIADGTLLTTSIALLITILVAGLMAWIAAGLLTRPLDRLRHAMGDVANGRFDVPTDPGIERDDEIGELFRSFHGMTSRLAELERMKAEFLGIASHDLKTPINVISGYAQLIGEADVLLDGRYREMLQALEEQAHALGQRVNQLIELSRMETRSLKLGLEEINVRHFAAGLEKAFGPVAAGHGVGLRVTVLEDAPRFLVADPDCLRTDALGNLLGHAIKFSPPGGLVGVTFHGASGRLVVDVTDHGPAVPPEEMPQLFDRYFRGPTPSGRAGSGMALPLAGAAVEAHGGTITVESGDAQTTFRLDLPLRPVAVSVAEPPATPAVS